MIQVNGTHRPAAGPVSEAPCGGWPPAAPDAQQAVDLVERVGAGNIFVHLDTYHMNIEEKGAGLGILVARDHLKYMHLPESDRGTPGEGNCPWDAIFTALAAIDFKGGLAMESFINLPPEIGAGLSVWRPVAKSEAEVMGRGQPFLRNKALQIKAFARSSTPATSR